MASNSEYEQRCSWASDWLNECAKRFIDNKLNVAKPLKSDTFQLLIKKEWFNGWKHIRPEDIMCFKSKQHSKREIEWLKSEDGEHYWRYKPNK